MGRTGDGERARLTRVFGAYGEDPGRRRAWDAGNPGNAALREELARATLDVLAAGDPGGLILDAGCGTGWWLARLLGAGVAPGRVAGIELLSDRARAARARAPGVRVIEGDVRALPLEPGSCAMITLFTVLSGMAARADVLSALREARRVLAPGGAAVVWEPRVRTANPDTRLIRVRDLRQGLGVELQVRSITLAPPIARRAGRAYQALAALPLLRSHRLAVARPV